MQKAVHTEVWPENWPVFQLFRQLQSQWRAGPNGVIGLDYNVLFHKLDRMDLSAEQYDEWERDIQVMEFAAIDEMNQKRE